MDVPGRLVLIEMLEIGRVHHMIERSFRDHRTSWGWVDAWSLQKLLYYVQAWHVAITDRPLFGERIRAWKDGPVVPRVWRARREQDSRRASSQHLDRIDIEPLASDLIDLVLSTYGSMTGDELRALIHVEAPWTEARGGLTEDDSCQEEISLHAMARFYRESRLLGGRTAADLAATGIYIRSEHVTGPVNVDAFLSSMGNEYDDPGEDRWGGANLIDSRGYSEDGIETRRRRFYVDG